MNFFGGGGVLVLVWGLVLRADYSKFISVISSLPPPPCSIFGGETPPRGKEEAK